VEKVVFSMEKTAPAKIVFAGKNPKTYQLVSALTAQSFNYFSLIQMSAWK